MGLFNKPDIQKHTVQMQSEIKPVQEIEMVIEYFDQTSETILLIHNLEELQQQISLSLGAANASMNFPEATPPLSLNPRWIKKITYKVKGGDSM